MGKVFDVSAGTLVKLDTGITLGTPSVKCIYDKKPNGTIVILAATVVETTKLQHTKATDTLSAVDKHVLQAYAVLASGDVVVGEEYELIIHESLKTQSG